MEIKIYKERMGAYDTGGGMREVSAVITIEKDYPKQLQMKVALYEALAANLDSILTHEKLEDLADMVLDVVNQVEAQENSMEVK